MFKFFIIYKKERCWTSVYATTAVRGVLLKRCYDKFGRIHKTASLFWCFLVNFAPTASDYSSIISKGAYIKYVEWGKGAGGFYKFFKIFFVILETIDLNISWPTNFFRKYFMAPPINFSFLFKAYLQQYFRVVLSNIQISNHQRSWHSQ